MTAHFLQTHSIALILVLGFVSLIIYLVIHEKVENRKSKNEEEQKKHRN